jgi:hypothetical protein
MHKSNALKNKGIANGMGASESKTMNMVSHIHVKRGSRNCIHAVLIHTNGKEARPPCGQR